MTLWAYFISDVRGICGVDNEALFSLIRDASLTEAYIFTDNIFDERTELARLLCVVRRGDTLMVRSLADLADGGAGLVQSLQELEDRGIEVASVSEPWYDYKTGFEQVARIVAVTAEQAERKRRLGMERAKQEGRMGRKKDERKTEQMKKLRSAGLSVREISELCGVSRSTYYRQVGGNKK